MCPMGSGPPSTLTPFIQSTFHLDQNAGRWELFFSLAKKWSPGKLNLAKITPLSYDGYVQRPSLLQPQHLQINPAAPHMPP